MTVPLMSLLAMDAGPAGTDILPGDAIGDTRSVLEAAGHVDVAYQDFGRRSTGSAGFIGYGAAETKYRRLLTLAFSNVQRGTIQWLRLHYQAYVADGGRPFRYKLPKTDASFWVQYRGAPQLSIRGAQGGNAATVVLEEVFVTD